MKWLIAFLGVLASDAFAIDVTSMYRGSCQVDTGVILRVDAKTVTFLAISGEVKRIPRFEIVGMASYPLPDLPIETVTVPPGVEAELFEFQTYRDGKLAPLAQGWPIEYNAEHVQVLTTTGKDHLVVRDEIWGVKSSEAPRTLRFSEGEAHGARYKLRHPLAFEKCADNVTPGKGEPIPVIPQVTYDNPIAIKRYHDHLREGFRLIKDYEDRQRFYAVPQYYTNRTQLGTWGILGSRYGNVGSRQTNFLPLVQDELSDGPFRFQRIVRSGVAPIAWALHEEPVVQIFYGLKADYVHLEVFFDPTAPLIGEQYNYAKGQLDEVDDRLIEKGGLEFGFDFGYVSLYMAYTEGNMGIRAGDYFTDGAFGSGRTGLSYQYNWYKAGFYVGTDTVELDDYVKHDFRFLKLFAQGPLAPRLTLKGQLIDRKLQDRSDDAKTPVHYDGESRTVAGEVEWAIDYRWTLRVLTSLERRSASYVLKDGSSDDVAKVHPKLASGVTVMF